MINIFLTNLGKYNEGELVGKWVELPVSNEKLQEVLQEIGINEEYFITDYEIDIKGIEISEYANLDDLNKIAKTLDNLDNSELDQVKTLLEGKYITLEDIEKNNLDLDDYRFLYLDETEYNKDIALGYELAEIEGLNEKLEELGVSSYFDYEAYGRNAIISGAFVGNYNMAVL